MLGPKFSLAKDQRGVLRDGPLTFSRERRPDQDVLGAAHSRGMRLSARIDSLKVQGRVAEEHPDWLHGSLKGEWQNQTAGLVSVCPPGQYYQQRIFDILDEVTSRYQVDGFFVNWTGFSERVYLKVYHGVCHGKSCGARWRKYAGDLGLTHGSEDANYPNAFVAEKLPDAGPILGGGAQIWFHEANNAVGRETWHHATSETVSSLTSYRPEVPVLANSVSFMAMPYRMGSEELGQFAQYLLQTVSRGGNPSTYIRCTRETPYLGLDIAKIITNFHRKWQEVYDGLEPVANTGLVSPHGGQMNETQYEEAFSEFRGLCSGMQELHISLTSFHRVTYPRHLRAKDSRRHDVVILPNLGKPRSEDASILDEWVAQGGRLIATGTSGVGDGGVAQLKALPTERQRDVIMHQESL
ncbi:hypothetical protein DL764_008229 [Monosporascus ibericus]|uniref:Beta-galactosidase trimerisation domain-containing protein n=1 Tax=Monosporascus ibericus TaxID=155417 RepID=A0A4Q4SY01_9PEZI|nr:hypothetical protein DL764_008229 [Monosporascus ibericus]